MVTLVPGTLLLTVGACARASEATSGASTSAVATHMAFVIDFIGTVPSRGFELPALSQSNTLPVTPASGMRADREVTGGSARYGTAMRHNAYDNVRAAWRSELVDC